MLTNRIAKYSMHVNSIRTQHYKCTDEMSTKKSNKKVKKSVRKEHKNKILYYIKVLRIL
jgi:hypothetical protein